MSGNEIVVVRHATTPWSFEGRHTSRTEIDLNDAGVAEAVRLRSVLSGRTYRTVLSSPRRRALRTCELAGLGDRVVVSEDVVEWDYGDAEGLTTAEIREIHPGWSLFRDGPPGGEQLSEVAVRADRVIECLTHACSRPVHRVLPRTLPAHPRPPAGSVSSPKSAPILLSTPPA